MKKVIVRILDCLTERKVRATYGAVNEYLISEGIIGENILPWGWREWLGEPSPYSSWVVNKETEIPTGYAEGEMHPDLKLHSEIITNGERLKEVVDASKK